MRGGIPATAANKEIRRTIPADTSFAIFADGIAGIPTVIKSFRFPETENYLEFLGSFISVTLSMLAIKIWNFTHYAFPGYIFFFDLATIILIRFKIGKRFVK